MNGHDLRTIRDRRGLTQQQLADLLNPALERNYAKGEVGRWENGRRPVPKVVEEFLTSLDVLETAEALGQLTALEEPEPRVVEGEWEEPLESGFSSGRGDGDSAPPPPPGSGRGQLPLSTGDPQLARVCEELWEMIATGVGLFGAATKSDALKMDGEIISSDKKALGRAWGKLAETNATFRRMLLGATTSGAWLEVAMVSGITFGKCARNHQALAAMKAQAAMPQAEDGNPEGFDGSQIPGYPPAAAA